MSDLQKRIRNKSNALRFLLPALIFILTVLILNGDSIRFEHLAEALFQSQLSGNTLTLHYMLAEPEKYHIDEPAALPVYSAAPEEPDDVSTALDALDAISPGRLDSSAAYTYRLLNTYLSIQSRSAGLNYYAEPFAPSSGILSSLPVLLADYRFRCKKDVEDYLEILEQTDEYLDGLLVFEREKADAGLFMADYSAEKVIRQGTSIMDRQSLSKGTHFLHSTFEERLLALEEAGLITADEKAFYLSENDRLLTCVLAPAYEKCADTFTLLMGSGTNEGGLCHYPRGKDYYVYLLAASTGSGRSIPEIKQLLLSDFQKNYKALLKLAGEHPDFNYNDTRDMLSSLPLDSKEVLQELQEKMCRDFPSLPSAGTAFKPQITVKPVSAAMENYTAPAYYLIPPIDDMDENVIYINQKNTVDALAFYTTLAHEGYPGHLYQTVYHQLNLTDEPSSRLRRLLSYGGFVEGWAYYTENLSYTYAAESFSGRFPPEKTEDIYLYCEACRLNRNLHLCLYSLLDIAIHYDGADRECVRQLLKNIGITDAKTCEAVYQYIVEEPVNYLKYYLGYLEILSLKQEAAALWGSRFSPQAFHYFLLEMGPADFPALKEQLLLRSPAPAVSS